MEFLLLCRRSKINLISSISISEAIIFCPDINSVEESIMTPVQLKESTF